MKLTAKNINKLSRIISDYSDTYYAALQKDMPESKSIEKDLKWAKKLLSNLKTKWKLK